MVYIVAGVLLLAGLILQLFSILIRWRICRVLTPYLAGWVPALHLEMPRYVKVIQKIEEFRNTRTQPFTKYDNIFRLVGRKEGDLTLLDLIEAEWIERGGFLRCHVSSSNSYTKWSTVWSAVSSMLPEGEDIGRAKKRAARYIKRLGFDIDIHKTGLSSGQNTAAGLIAALVRAKCIRKGKIHVHLFLYCPFRGMTEDQKYDAADFIVDMSYEDTVVIATDSPPRLLFACSVHL